MVALQILVLPVQVRVLISQRGKEKRDVSPFLVNGPEPFAEYIDVLVIA